MVRSITLWSVSAINERYRGSKEQRDGIMTRVGIQSVSESDAFCFPIVKYQLFLSDLTRYLSFTLLLSCLLGTTFVWTLHSPLVMPRKTILYVSANPIDQDKIYENVEKDGIKYATSAYNGV